MKNAAMIISATNAVLIQTAQMDRHAITTNANALLTQTAPQVKYAKMALVQPPLLPATLPAQALKNAAMIISATNAAPIQIAHMEKLALMASDALRKKKSVT